jgi:DNA-binding NarL/FixJ family response regulator
VGLADDTRVNPAGLTTRHVDVLRLLGKGYKNAQIASQLVVSARTVNSHVAAVLGKLGTASRREAATCAAELGALDAQDRQPVAPASVTPADAAWLPLGISLVSGF